MNLDQAFKKIRKLLFGFRNSKLFCLINLLIFIKQSVWDDGQIHFVFLFFLIFIIVVVLVVNLKETHGIYHAEPSYHLDLVIIHHKFR
jgi:Trk-type K+ transport system membrane component